jgi:hypothetical protein
MTETNYVRAVKKEIGRSAFYFQSLFIAFILAAKVR